MGAARAGSGRSDGTEQRGTMRLRVLPVGRAVSSCVASRVPHVLVWLVCVDVDRGARILLEYVWCRSIARGCERGMSVGIDRKYNQHT